jgi:ribosomal protein S18 acetylase RimI-like enzyme
MGGDDWAERIEAALGERVALRFRIGEIDGRPLFTDAVGPLSAGTPGEVVVDTRKGPVRVDRSTVVALRVVPPAPARRASWSAVARLENLCADAWPALVDEPLGAWRLRAAGGFTGRANSALAAGDPGLALDAALDRVRSFAAAHGIGPRLQTPMGSPWSRAAQRAGWVPDTGHEAGCEVAVLVTELAAVPAALELTPQPPADWWAVDGASPHGPEGHVLTAAATLGFGVARSATGEPVGVVRAAVVEDHLHVSRLRTVPAARRTGVATALMAGAATWGVARGARYGVSQVALDNEPALALHRGAGWTEHHRYHYLIEAAGHPASRSTRPPHAPRA